LGVRSITGAALAGLSFALLPGVFTTYLPVRLGELPAVLFGLGAISVARNPEGVVAQNARQLRLLLAKFVPGPPDTVDADAVSGPQDASGGAVDLATRTKGKVAP
jgi:branched-chain amino acid transport system permease protein